MKKAISAQDTYTILSGIISTVIQNIHHSNYRSQNGNTRFEYLT